MAEPFILASASPFRKAMLANAGLDFTVVSAEIDERAVEAPLLATGATPGDVAEVLATAKADDVSARHPGRLVLGCDQTLSLGEEIFHKPIDMEAARRQLLKLSGNTHQLNSAAVLVRDGERLWSTVSVATMTMRPLDPAFIGRHLARVGAQALQSVGAYQIEGQGVQLFNRIEGDHFTIVGVPLLPLFDALRKLRAIDG